MAAFTAATQIMGSDARKAITTLTFFTGIASTVFWPVTEAMSGALGWRVMLLIFAGLHLFVCLPIHFKVLPSRAAHRSRLMSTVVPPERGVLPKSRRRLGFTLIAAASALHGLVGWGLALHFIELFKAMGLPAASAVAIASLNGIMQISARGGEFLSGGRHSPVITGVIAVAMQPVAFLGLLGFGASNLTALLFIVGYGLSAGLMTIARAALPLWLFGRATYGAYSGRLNLPQNLIFGAAPLVFALVIERFGPMAALWSAFAASVGATIAMAYLARLVGSHEVDAEAASATE